MRLKPLVAAVLLSCASLAGSATDLGELTSSPKEQVLSISASDVTFATQYFFSLAEAAKVSGGATNLSLGGAPVLGISNFSLKLFDSSNTLLATASLVDNAYRIDDFPLAASNYYFQVAGETSGRSGGSYSFATVAEPSITLSTPEPASLWLLGLGLAAIGITRTRAGAARQR